VAKLGQARGLLQREDFKHWACDNWSIREHDDASRKRDGRFDDKSSNCATTDKALIVPDHERRN
jgi:hypothetical protein